MKKLLSILLVATLSLSLLAGCGKSKNTIVVGASPTPHAEILKVAQGVLEKQGYKMEIKEFSDYIQPNVALADGTLDANYFQHLPYLEDYNAENGTDLISMAAIHYEPFGIYPGRTTSLAKLRDGATISVPNDTTNEARALALLEAQGLITIDPDAGLKATVQDIIDNPHSLKIQEIEAAQLARSLQDVDLAVINGNYAIQAGLNAASDAIATEGKDSLGATFANILAVRNGDENREELKALVAALQSDEVQAYIEETFQGAVVPMF